MVLARVAKIHFTLPLELLSPDPAEKLRSLGLEPYRKEFLDFLRGVHLYFVKQDIFKSEKRWKKTSVFAEEFISRTHFSVTDQRQVNFAVLWRLFDLLRRETFSIELTRIFADSNFKSAGFFVEVLKNHFTKTFFINGDWDEVLQDVHAKNHVDLGIQCTAKAHSQRLGTEFNEENVKNCIDWIKNEMVIKDRQGRVVDLWNESVTNHLNNTPKRANNLDDFVAEINTRFEQEILSEIEVLGELSPSAPELVELFLSFPPALIAASVDLQSLDTFDEIHATVKSLFEVLVRAALKEKCGLAEDFPLLDDVVFSKAQSFAEMSKSVVQKHFSLVKLFLRSEKHYVDMMKGLALDVNRPEDFFDSQLRNRVAISSFKVDDKDFQAFMKKVFALVWTRADAPKQPVPLFEELDEPIQESALAPSCTRALQNELTMQILSLLLKQPSFFAEMSSLIQKLVGSPGFSQLYTKAIVESLSSLCSQSSIFNAVPDGAKMPQKAQKLIFDRILEAWD